MSHKDYIAGEIDVFIRDVHVRRMGLDSPASLEDINKVLHLLKMVLAEIPSEAEDETSN